MARENTRGRRTRSSRPSSAARGAASRGVAPGGAASKARAPRDVAPEGAAPGEPLDHLIRVTSKRAVEIRGDRAAGGGPPRIRIADHRPDDVVEVELEGGVRLVTTLAQYLEDFPEAQDRAVSRLEPGELALPVAIPLGGPARGPGDWVIAGLRILGIDPVEKAGELTALKVCEWYEARQLEKDPATKRGEQRLWRVGEGDGPVLEPVSDLTAAPGPMLVFVHGTASSTRGSFGGLWEGPLQRVRDELLKPYRGHVFAFEHLSLTQSPTENTLALVDALPADARVHLVTHSRGGLIGELLCRGQRVGAAAFREKEEVKPLFGDPVRKEEADNLRKLGTRLADKKIVVERFARVACPARGTTLASERLDRWLSVALHLIGLVPPLKASGFFDVFEEFVRALVKTRANPRALPGLEAQMPDAPLINLLNRPGVTVGSDLHVIAGDVEGGRTWQRLGVLLTDLFYEFEDHDLVVNTAAMYGGADRAAGARYFFTQGADVSHFNYFRNKETSERLVAALQEGPERDGFKMFSPSHKKDSRGAAAPTGRRPVLFVLPDLMGSHLEVAEARVWLDLPALAGGAFSRLRNGQDATPTGLVETAYDDLVAFLGTSLEVVPFPFDWRRSLVDEARRLASALEARLGPGAPDQPVSVLGHGMGGLLAQVTMARHPEVWTRLLRHERSRLILLGVPTGGTHAVVRLLLGRDALVCGLGVVDPALSRRKLLEIVSAYPGVLEMLPRPEPERDFFDPRLWELLAREDAGDWVAPDAEALGRARLVRQILDRPLAHPDRVCYVAGWAARTPTAIVVGDRPRRVVPQAWGSGRVEDPLQFEVSERGDGRVPWDTGIPAGVRVWFMDAAHGDLAGHEPAFPALLDLVLTGETDRLRMSEPATAERAARGRQGPRPPRRRVPAAALEVYPDQEALARAALGRAPRTRRRRPARTRVRVVHGNLSFARHAVVVGHYQGDTIISAEAQIDRQLGGRLTRRQALGLYPGPLNTSETLSGEGAFPGALVVGLGKVGELKAGLLTETFARALVAHALNRLESLEISARGAVAEVTLSSLLIGTTAAGLTIRDAADALLRGVRHANQRLQHARLADRVRIAAVEFIELYRDRAIEAARVLADVVRDPELEREFDLAREVETSDGGRYRVAFEQATGWWDRLQILEENGQLKITALTDRARAEVSILPTQRSLIDQFIGQAIGSTRSDERIASTLFELLWPNDLKPFARERRDLVLVVNDAAAAYPWELMHDGLSGAAEGAATDEFHAPLAVQAGMIRQREAPDHRARIMGPVSNTALVVGDPDLAYPLGVANELALSQLPGAREEAETVRALLRAHAYETSAVIHETSDEIVRELFARPYRILHLAGHGLYRFSPGGGPAPGDRSSAAPGRDRAYGASPGTVVPAATPDQPMTGMLIGNLVFLTPAEIEQMRYVPDLVFINCCFSGMDQTGLGPARRDRHRLAANISTQLIRMGVRAVVAAGWAVDDGAARTFAEEFYRRMLGGERFGRAVQAARKRAYAGHPGVNTWGAYQCYGDPDFRLITETTDGERSGGGLAFFTPDELIAELDNLRQDALASDGPETADRLRARLKALESRIPVAWRKAGGVCAALGQAHGEIDDFERAIQCYEDALKAEGANVPVRAIEQLANLKARWAVSLHQHSPSAMRAGPEPDALVTEALGHLDLLIALAPTAERLSLKGSAFKRQAWLAGDVAARRLALEAMRDAYEKGASATVVPADQRTPRDYYAHTNALTARFILGLHAQDGGALAADARALFAEIAASEERRAGREGDFWSHSARGDRLSLDHMIAGDLASHVEVVVGAYREARQRASSPRQWKSILEHYDFLIEMAGQAPGQGPLAAALGRIRTALADD